eukprot:gene8405-17014_t
MTGYEEAPVKVNWLQWLGTQISFGDHITLPAAVWDKLRLGVAFVRSLQGAQVSLCVAFLNGGVHSLMSHHYFASVVRTADLDAINSQCREVVRRAAAGRAPQLPNALLHCEPPHGLNLHDAHMHQAMVILTGKWAWNACPEDIFQTIKQGWVSMARAWNLCPNTVLPSRAYAALRGMRAGGQHPRGSLIGMIMWAVSKLGTMSFTFNE